MLMVMVMVSPILWHSQSTLTLRLSISSSGNTGLTYITLGKVRQACWTRTWMAWRSWRITARETTSCSYGMYWSVLSEWPVTDHWVIVSDGPIPYSKSKISIFIQKIENRDFLQTFGVDFDAVQTLHKTCVTMNACDRRTAIASRVIRPTSPTSPVNHRIYMKPNYAARLNRSKRTPSLRRRLQNYKTTFYQTSWERATEIIRLKAALLVRSKTVLIIVKSGRPTQLDSYRTADIRGWSQLSPQLRL